MKGNESKLHIGPITSLFLFAAILAATYGPAAMAVPGDIYNLGTLGWSSRGYSINDAAQVVGVSNNAEHAFCYTGTPGRGGAMTDLGTFGGTYSRAFDVNESGQIAGEYVYDSIRYFTHAFRYTGTPGLGGVMVDLGTLGGTRSGSYAINESGQVAGASLVSGDVAYHAFRYSGTPGAGGVMADLGTLGGTSSYAEDINDTGQVVGQSFTVGDTVEHAFLYTGTPGTGGVMSDLGTLGGPYSGARAINNAGQITGSSSTANGVYHAFRYTGTPGAGGVMIDLGSVGTANSWGLDINHAGFVVGECSLPTGNTHWAMLWLTDAANTAINLDAWLDATNPTLGAYWQLRTAYGINNNGLITGSGYYNDGPGGLSDGERAFILDASSFIPEPSTLTLAGLAGFSLLRRRAVRE